MKRLDFDFEAFYRDLKEQEKLLSQPVQRPPESPRNPRFQRATRLRRAVTHRMIFWRVRAGQEIAIAN